MFPRKPDPDLIGGGHRFADKEHAQRKNLQPFPPHHSPGCDSIRVEMAVERRLKAVAAGQCPPEMQRVGPEAEIRITATNRVPPYAADTASGIVPLTLKLAGQNETLEHD